MAYTKENPEEITAILARGRLALKVLIWVNGIALLITTLLGFTPYQSFATYSVFVFLTMELLFFVLWFIPAFIFHLAFRKRGFRESASRSLWSVVEAISYVTPG